MIKRIVLLFGAFASSVSANGLNDYFISIEPSVMNYKNTSDVGATSTQRVVYPVTLTLEYSIDRINRLRINLRGIDAQFKPGVNGVGVDTQGYQLSYSWNRKIRLARNFKPWLGVGLVSGFFDNTNRLSTDSDGFISQTFEDTKKTIFSISVNASADWELSRLWFLSMNTIYEMPVGDGLQGFGVVAGIKYRF